MKRQRLRKGIIFVSFLLLPITLYYFSPFLIIQGAAEGVLAGCAIVFVLMFLTSLFFGKAFCGWVCPVGGLQEGLGQAQDKRVKGGRLNWIKYFVWLPWLGTIVFAGISAGGIKKMDFIYQTNFGISVTEIHALVMYYIVLTIIVVLSLTAGRRSFCHYGYWMAPFMIIGTKIKDTLGYPSLHLVAEPGRCTSCGQCTKKCLMSLEVDKMVKKGSMLNDECILCGECADTCTRKVICFKLKTKEV